MLLQKINKKYRRCRRQTGSNLPVTIFLITLINTSKLNKIVSQNERTEDETALILPSPSALLGRRKGRGHINIYIHRSVPSSVLLNNAPKWDTISWSLRLQRPTIRGFGHKNYHSYQYQQDSHIFVLFLYPLSVFFLVSGNISLLKNILAAFLFYCELKYF